MIGIDGSLGKERIKREMFFYLRRFYKGGIYRDGGIFSGRECFSRLLVRTSWRDIFFR